MTQERFRMPRRRTARDRAELKVAEQQWPEPPVTEEIDLERDEPVLPEPEPEEAGTKAIPAKPFDKLLWKAYVRGAAWGVGEGFVYAWDEADYYEGTAYGQEMLGDFYALLDDERPEAAMARTLCPVGRPYRDHIKSCHPSCDWKQAMR